MRVAPTGFNEGILTRQEQFMTALEIAESIERDGNLMIEVGTGTGKRSSIPGTDCIRLYLDYESGSCLYKNKNPSRSAL